MSDQPVLSEHHYRLWVGSKGGTEGLAQAPPHPAEEEVCPLQLGPEWDPQWVPSLAACLFLKVLLGAGILQGERGVICTSTWGLPWVPAAGILRPLLTCEVLLQQVLFIVMFY